MRILLMAFVSLFCLGSFAFRKNDFKWTLVTNPYRNYIYPSQTGLIYTVNYNYAEESKALRRYLNNNYDLKASPSLHKIVRGLSNGSCFNRTLELKFKYLQEDDTVYLKCHYESGDSTLEKISGSSSKLYCVLDLTQHKDEHDFTLGKIKEKGRLGLIRKVDVFVKRPRWSKYHVTVLSKFITHVNMPSVLTRIRGNRWIQN